MALNLKRPISVIDLETTGTDINTARIVSIGIVVIGIDGKIKSTDEIFINPGMKIPKDAFDVHGITDETVKDAPRFEDIAGDIVDRLHGSDLSGYNIEKYDLPIIMREFERVGIDDFGKDMKVVDVMRIFQKNVRQDLASAVKFYLNRAHHDAHSAASDAKVTAEVLLKQIEKHDLPGDADGLEEYCREKDPNFVDQDGKLIWMHGEAVINFGKMKGRSLKDVADTNPDYLEWMLTKDFSDEVKEIIKKALVKA